MANGNKPLPGVSQRSKPFEILKLSHPNNTQFSLGTVSSIDWGTEKCYCSKREKG